MQFLSRPLRGQMWGEHTANIVLGSQSCPYAPVWSPSPTPRASSTPSAFLPRACTKRPSRLWGRVPPRRIRGDAFRLRHSLDYPRKSAGGRAHDQCGEGAFVARWWRAQPERAGEEESPAGAVEEVNERASGMPCIRAPGVADWLRSGPLTSIYWRSSRTRR